MKRLFLLPIAAALPLLLAACGGKPAAGFQMPPRPVTAIPVAQEDVPVYLDEIGTCVSPQIVSIIPQVTGKVTEVLFEEGADVKKGDPLFTIDPRPYVAAEAQAEATLLQDQSKLQTAASQYERSTKLSAGGYISAQDLENLKTTAAAAAAQVKADEAALENAKLNVEYCHIAAPIDGRLGKRLVDVGNVVTANLGTASASAGSTPSGASALVTIQKVDKLYVDFTVAETDLPSVRSHLAAGGAPLKVIASLPDDPKVNREGVLSFLDNTVTSAAGTVQLRAVIDNAERTFWPGQFVDVRLVLETLKGAFLVPTQSLQISQQGPYVLLVKDDSTAEMRPIKPGQRQGDRTVVAGVKPGETVIVTGQLFLAPGGKVRVVDLNAPAPGAPASKP